MSRGTLQFVNTWGLRLTVALAAVLAVAGVRHLLVTMLHITVPGFALAYSAILAVAVLADLQAALITAAFIFVSATWFIFWPSLVAGTPRVAVLVQVVLFVAMSIFIVLVGYFFRRNQKHLTEQEVLAAHGEAGHRFAAAMASMTKAVFIVDTQGNITHFNPAFVSFYRFQCQEECSRNLNAFRSRIEIQTPDGAPVPVYDRPAMLALRGESNSGQVCNLRRIDTGEVWSGAFSYSPIRDDAGAITGAVVSARDITAQLAVETALLASDLRYRTAFETSQDGIAISRISDQIFLDVNPAFVRLTGWELDEIIGHTSLELNLFPDLAERQSLLDTLARDGQFREIEAHFRRRNGEIVRVAFSATVMDVNGISYAHATLRDVTDQRSAEQARNASEARYRTIFQSSLDALVIFRSSDRVYVDASRAYCDLTGWSREELVGKNPKGLRIWKDPNTLATAVDMFNSGKRLVNFPAEFVKKSGESIHVLLSTTPIVVDNEPCTLTIIRDVSAVKQAESEIRQLSYFDPLTGLPNRRLLDERLALCIDDRDRDRHYLALLCIDLDNFQTINNALGHSTGDAILRIISQRLNDTLRSGDLVARAGGDKFLVLLCRLDNNRETAAAQVRAVTHKIMEAIQSLISIDGHETICNCSVGITLENSRPAANTDLLQWADIAMHRAKEAGRNTFRFFSPDHQEAVTERAFLEEDLRHAIHDEQLTLLYQPQVERGQIIGVEALLRWQHPRLGVIPPVKFIPLAEQTRLILPLDNWVLRTACNQLAKWSAAFPGLNFSIAVNISALDLRQEDFVQSVLATVRDSGADPRRIKLELTESMLADNIEDTVAKMTALKFEGITFSLDDFGTGYSSLSYLRKLPLSQLKIDRSFVRDILTEPGSTAIAQTIITLSHALGVPVIAEGVETTEQRACLAGMGCHTYQGYLYSQPIPAAEFESLLGAGGHLLPSSNRV